jgi:serine/threonine-protein kinase
LYPEPSLPTKEPLPTAPPQQPRHPDNLVGAEIAGRYRVIKLVARGGMGAVYEAEQHPLRRKVAIKVLHHGNSVEGAEFERRFLLEAEALARLQHANTVVVHDYGQTPGGMYYLVMEYVQGRPLSRLLQDEGPLEPTRCIDLMTQVCKALREAHSLGIVHRDLKPSNLLVRRQEDGEEVVKVVDFGLVKLTEADQSLTLSGMILGSPHCMSPEQVQGMDIDHRADIYSLGVLMYRSLTGKYPFHGPTTAATMIAHVQNPIPHMAEAGPDLELPLGLEDVIRRCLSKAPQERYQDMGALIADLGTCSKVPTRDYVNVSTVITPPRNTQLFKWGAGIGLLLAMIAVALVSLSPGDSGTATLLTDLPELQTEVEVAAPVRVTLTSTPPGALVTVDGQTLGPTPLETELEARNAPSDVRTFLFALDGHDPIQAQRDLVGRTTLAIDVSLTPQGLEDAVARQPVAPGPVTDAQPPTPRKPRVRTPPKPAPEPAAPEPATAEPLPPAGYKSSPYD